MNIQFHEGRQTLREEAGGFWKGYVPMNLVLSYLSLFLYGIVCLSIMRYQLS